MHNFVYAIVRVNDETFLNIQHELDIAGFSYLKAVVHHVPVLVSTRGGGKKEYIQVPLLFNYGFIRVPLELLYNREFVNEIPKVVPSIYGWLLSPEHLHKKKIKMRVDNRDIWDDFTQVAIASKKEVLHLKRLAKAHQVFGLEDLATVPIGSYITLRGYPYEGLGATLLEVNLNTKQVKVQICETIASLDIWLDFEHVYYSPYCQERKEHRSGGDVELL